MKLSREFYIPKGSVKVADKLSDAVAYLSTNSKGKPRATVFFGKQSKPVADYFYKDEEQRAKRIAEMFQNRRDYAKRVNDRREAAKSFKHSVQIGDIFATHWGYEQTNVEFFEVIEVRGKHAIIRELCQVTEETGFMTGKCVPQSGSYHGEPIRRLIQDGFIKINSYRFARPWGQRIAGTVVGKPERWSSYA